MPLYQCELKTKNRGIDSCVKTKFKEYKINKTELYLFLISVYWNSINKRRLISYSSWNIIWWNMYPLICVFDSVFVHTSFSCNAGNPWKKIIHQEPCIDIKTKIILRFNHKERMYKIINMLTTKYLFWQRAKNYYVFCL